MFKDIFNWEIRRRMVLLFLLVLSAAGILFATLLPTLTQVSQSRLAIGDVATQDYLAPYALSYDSDVLTEEKRLAASTAVQPIYSDVDPGIARNQLDRLRAALLFISSVRSDLYAAPEQKLEDMGALHDVSLSREMAESILALSETRWLLVQQEATTLLEQVMRSEIRSNDLEATLRGVPAMVSLSLPEDQAAIVSELVKAFVNPNSFYDPEKTKLAVLDAQEAVDPVFQAFVPGQTITARGQVIDAQALEALEKFGMIKSTITWQEIASAVLVTLLILVYFVIFLSRNSRLVQDIRSPMIFTALFLAFLIGARLLLPGHTVLPYVYPTMALSMTLVVLFGSDVALISILPLALLISYQLPRPLELVLFIAFGSFFGAWALHRVSRVTAFFVSGLQAAAAGIAVLVIFRLTDPGSDWIGLLTVCVAALGAGLASAVISLVLQFFLAQFLGKISPLQLIELTRPDHPLLQFLLRNAPGTYQHSLQVANLAEQAAERIGADALLTRVGTLYHDIGKALNPFYFIENQIPGQLNPHDDLDPTESAATIIRHIDDGINLARKHHLPRRIIDFIQEHHGTMLTSYQYVRAVEKAGGDESAVDQSLFRYHGPTPNSRETALLLLADGCEARVRAERPQTEDQLRQIVRAMAQDRLHSGQLSNVSLTLRQLDMIVDSFTETMRGVYHPRIEYPTLGPAAQVDPSLGPGVRSPVIPALPSPSAPPEKNNG
jgi:putative nucleotidyltransferase with HDIG domain